MEIEEEEEEEEKIIEVSKSNRYLTASEIATDEFLN